MSIDFTNCKIVLGKILLQASNKTNVHILISFFGMSTSETYLESRSNICSKYRGERTEQL